MDLRMLIPIFGIMLVMIPVAGLTLTLVTRFAFQPLAKTIADAIRETGYGGRTLEDRDEILRLTEQLESLTSEVERLRTLGEFDRQLVGSGEKSTD